MKRATKAKSPLATLIPDLPHRDLDTQLDYGTWVQDLMRGVAKVLYFFNQETAEKIQPDKVCDINRGLAVALDEGAEFLGETIQHAREAHKQILSDRDPDKEVAHAEAQN